MGGEKKKKKTEMRKDGPVFNLDLFLENRGHLNSGGYRHFAHFEVPDLSF